MSLFDRFRSRKNVIVENVEPNRVHNVGVDDRFCNINMPIIITHTTVKPTIFDLFALFNCSSLFAYLNCSSIVVPPKSLNAYVCISYVMPGHVFQENPPEISYKAQVFHSNSLVSC